MTVNRDYWTYPKHDAQDAGRGPIVSDEMSWREVLTWAAAMVAVAVIGLFALAGLDA